MRRQLIFTFTVLFLHFIFSSPLFAQQIAEKNETVIVSEDFIIDEDYFAAGETVTIYGTINADAYLVGETIFIDGTVNGDVLAAGGTIMIRGTVSDNVRVIGGTVTVTGEIGGNMTVLSGTTLVTDSATISGSIVGGSGTLDIFAPVGRGMTFGAGQAVIGSQVDGNILAGVGELTLVNNAVINGDLTYYSDLSSEMKTTGNATVSGTITQRVPIATEESLKKEAGTFLAGVGLFVKTLSLLSALVTGMLLVYFAPNFTLGVNDKLTKKPIASLLIGILFYVLFPVIVLLLLISLVGIPLAVLFILSVFFLLFFAKIFVMVFIGTMLMAYLKQKQSLGWVFFVGLVVYGFLSFFPVIGGFISIFSLLAGTGALLLHKKDMYTSLRTKKIL